MNDRQGAGILASTTSARTFACSRQLRSAGDSASARRLQWCRELNRTLEERVRTQVVELERLRRLRRFLSPQLADPIVSSGDESILQRHRRHVAMFFADLRGWTSFVDTVETAYSCC